jgi:transposase-like protein
MVRNSLRVVSSKVRKAAAADLKKIYTSAIIEEPERELQAFGGRWDGQ